MNLEGNHLDVCFSFCHPIQYPENEILQKIYTYVYKLTYFTSLLPFAIKKKHHFEFRPKKKTPSTKIEPRLTAVKPWVKLHQGPQVVYVETLQRVGGPFKQPFEKEAKNRFGKPSILNRDGKVFC